MTIPSWADLLPTIPLPGLMDLAGVGVWIIDQHFVTLGVNQHMAEMLGTKPEWIRARPVTDFIAPEDLESSRQLWARRLEGVRETHEFRFRRPDGASFWALVAAAPVHGDDGGVTGAIAMVIDITARKKAEHRERSQRALMELVAMDLPIPLALRRVLSCSAEGCRGIHLVLLASEGACGSGGRKVLAASDGSEALVEALRMDPSETVPRIVGSGAFRLIREARVMIEGIHEAFLEAYASPSASIEPTCAGAMLEDAALAIRLVLTRGRTLAEVERSRAQLEKRVALKTEETLRQAAAMDATVEGMAILESGRYVYLNPAHARMYGYEPRDLLGESWERLYEQAEVDRLRATAFPVLQALGHWSGEVRGLRADGSAFDVEVNLTACPSGELVCACRDITLRKQQAETLLRSQEQLAMVLSATEDGFWDWDIGTGVVEMSLRWLEMLGYQQGELGCHFSAWESLLHPEDRERVLRQVADLLEGRILLYQNEHRLRTKSGEWRWVLTRGKVVARDAAGRPLRAVGAHTDVTDRRRLEEIVDTVLEAGEIGFWDHDIPSGRLKRRGHGWRRLGYGTEDLPAAMVDFPALIHPEDVEGTMESYRQFLERPEGRWEREFRMRGRAGEYRWGFSRASAIDSGPGGRALRVIGIRLDVHERHAKVSQIQWQGQMLRSIGDVQRRFLEGEEPRHVFDSLLRAALDLTGSEYGFIAEVLTEDGVPFMRSHAMTNIAWNDETRRLYEMAQKNGMEFRNLNTLFGQVLLRRELVIANDAPSDPRRGGIPRGHPPLNRFLGIPVFSGEELVGVVGLANRVKPYSEDLVQSIEPLLRTYSGLIVSLRREAARRQADGELQRRTHDLIEANAALERTARGRDEFLASMSHELRTPLTSILALTEVFRDGGVGALSDVQMRQIQLIDESGRHLLELINDVLEVARLEARLVRVEPVPCMVAEIIEGSARLLRAQAQGKRIRLRVDAGPFGLQVLADPLRLKQILTNLLSNAVKFTPPGGDVSLRVTRDSAAVHFCVEDTGIGIDPDKLPLLFQPFVQIDGGLARRYGGTGLGLVIVKRFAELLAGSVAVESVPGVGSRFTVSLPHPSITLPAAPEPQVVPPPALDGTTESPSLIRALIVEDNALNRAILADYLGNRGVEVSTAENGPDALRHLASAHADVVVLDIQMPGMDGLEVARRIRHLPDPERCRVPILALTALAMPGDRERCLSAGVTDYMAKPFALKDLARRLRELAAVSPG